MRHQSLKKHVTSNSELIPMSSQLSKFTGPGDDYQWFLTSQMESDIIYPTTELHPTH